MILVIDNYDSFTHNLVHLLAAANTEIVVERSDRLSVDEALARHPSLIVISPGPGHPGDRGISIDLIRAAAGRIPVFGVCLGQQALAVAFGGALVPAPAIIHGRTSPIRHDGKGCFTGVENPLTAMRYHSLVVDADRLPKEFTVSARSDEDPGVVMGIRSESLMLEGVQFHPESFLTKGGALLAANILKMSEWRRR